MIEGKKCSKCKQYKDISEFNRDKAYKDGLALYCKECKREYYEANKEKAKKYYEEYYEQNKEQIIKQTKEYYEQNKDNILRTKKEYREANKEQLSKKAKEYYEANKEQIIKKVKECQKEYRQTERGKMMCKLKDQRRRARKKSLPNTLTVEQWNQTLNDFNHSCANCGSKEKLHLDHFFPLAAEYRGTTASNCIPLCASCNLSKSSKHPKDFFSEDKLVEIAKYLLSRKNYK